MKPLRTLPKSRIKSAAAVLVTVCYAATNVLWATAPEAAFWSDRRRAARREGPTLLASALPTPLATSGALTDLPRPAVATADIASRLPAEFRERHAGLLAALTPDLGTLRSIAPGASTGPVVVFVQDIHQNDEAQKHIGAAVRALTEAGAVDVVALEGAFGPIDLNRLETHPRPDSVRVVADALLAEHKISGPVHAALGLGPAAPPLIGVDDPAHYRANVEAYRQSIALAEGVRRETRAAEEALAAQKAARLSPALRALDAARAEREDGRLSVGDYVGRLAAAAPDAVPPMTRAFLEALRLEASLDFDRAESERASVLSALAGRLNESEKNRLIEWSVAFRLGKVRHAAYHDFLRALCARRGVDWSRTPTFARYVEYVLKADALDGSALEASIAELERAAFDKNTRTPAEARWMAETRRLAWRRRLTEFALTPRDWAERESLAPVDGTLPDCFASFYREAAARDRAIAENLIRALGERSARRAVLVTGGYHAPGLTEVLRGAGATVVSFVPRVSRVDAARGSAYLSVFTQEKTPLEKIAAGERLFLAQDPAAGKAEAPFDVAALEESPPSLWALYEGVVPLRSVKFEGGVLRAEFSTGQSVDVRVERTPEGRPRFLQEARRNLREVFWRPLVEIPRTLDALEHRSAFLGFLRDHPVRVFGEESGAVAENLFHQRYRGLSQWIPAGVTLGLGFGLGALLAGFSIGGASLLAGNVASFVLELFFLTLVFGVSGGVGGLYAGHVLYNLFHPRARLALDPPPTPAAERGGYFPRLRRVTLEGGLIPHLRAEFDGNRETAVHLFFDARGKGPFRDRVLQYLRNAFWRPFVEMPWIVRALFSPAAFVDFLGRHSLVVTGGSLSRTVADDSSFRADMAAAVREARGDGPTGGFSPRVGAVLLDGQGRRLARGNNRGEGPHHAEQAALLRLLASRAPPGAADTDLLRLSIWPRVSRRQKTYEYNYREMIDLYLRTAARWGIDWSDVTVVTTLSPCRRCADLMAGLGIKKVVYGEPTPDAESVIARLRARGVGVASCSLGTETRPLMGWVFRIQRRFPSLHAGALTWLGGRQWPAVFLENEGGRPSVSPEETPVAEWGAAAERIFRQRHAGLTRWIPAGGILGLFLGAGLLPFLPLDLGSAWAGQGPLGFLLALAGPALLSLSGGALLGLYLGHAAYNLFHPRAPLAVEPTPVRFYLTPEVRGPLERDPAGLQNALARLAGLLQGFSRDIRVGLGEEPTIQLERDGGSLSLRVPPADLGSPAAFELRVRRLADRLKAHLRGPLRGRIVGFPVIHARASDFPGGTLSRFLRENPRSKITLFQELGGAATPERLNEIFSRHTQDYPLKLFDARPGAAPLSLAAFTADPVRAGWWAQLFAANQRIVRDGQKAMDDALASGHWPRVEALLPGDGFSRALGVWLFENYDRARPVREPLESDVELLFWQMVWLDQRPWAEGPWSIRGLAPRAAVETVLERLYQGELLLVKSSVLRNARLAAILRRMPIRPDVQGALAYGAAHFYGLRNDLIAWIAPDKDNRPGEGTGARDIAWMAQLPSYGLHRDLIHVLEAEFANPSEEDRRPFSPRIQRLVDLRPDLRPEWRRALLEKLAVRWVLRARALSVRVETSSFNDLAVEQVLHRAVHGLTDEVLEKWMEGAFRDTAESNQSAWNEINARALDPSMPEALRAQWMGALRIPVEAGPVVITARGIRFQFPAPFAAAAPADRNAIVAFLANRVLSRPPGVRVEEGAPAVRLARDRETLRLDVPADAFRSAADFETAAAPLLDALEATLDSPNRGRVIAFPLGHTRREDFPTEALNRLLAEGPGRRIALLLEVGSFFDGLFLRSAFSREPEAYARKLFGPTTAASGPLSLSDFRDDPSRAGWFDALFARQRAIVESGNAVLEKALREQRWEDVVARLSGRPFSEAVFAWLFAHPGRATWAREAVRPDVELMHWQAQWLRDMSWREGPWAPTDASPRAGVEAAVQRMTEILWLEAKRVFVRNARLTARVGATPIDPFTPVVFPVGMLHRAGLGEEGFEWVAPPTAGTAGSGTDAAIVNALISLPETRLVESLERRLAAFARPPTEEDLAPFSAWVRSLSDAPPALSGTERRWVLEVLLGWILTRPRAFGGEPGAPVDEAVVQRAVHEATRDWTDEALRAFLEPAFDRANGGPRGVRDAFLARASASSLPAEIRKAWVVPNGPTLNLGPLLLAAPDLLRSEAPRELVVAPPSDPADRPGAVLLFKPEIWNKALDPAGRGLSDSDKRRFIDDVLAALVARGAYVSGALFLNGAALRVKGFVDRQYENAVVRGKSRENTPAASLAEMTARTGVPIERIFGYEEAREGILRTLEPRATALERGPPAARARWEALRKSSAEDAYGLLWGDVAPPDGTRTKIGGAWCQVVEIGGERFLVLSGAPAGMKSRYYGPGAGVLMVEVRFPKGGAFGVREARRLIGPTDGAQAPGNTLRGMFRERFFRAADSSYNGLHLSAGPVEWAKERRIFFGRTPRLFTDRYDAGFLEALFRDPPPGSWLRAVPAGVDPDASVFAATEGLPWPQASAYLDRLYDQWRRESGVAAAPENPLPAVSPDQVAEEAQREALALGRAVSDRLVELQAEAPRTATTKPDGTQVSRADEEAMVTLAAGLLDAFPTHEIIGEEDLETLSPDLHRRNRANAGSPYQWFVDPLDGTETYLSGTDIFAVHLELQYDGRPLLAVVVLPRKGPEGGPLVVMARAGRAGLWVNGRWHAPLPPESFPTDFAELAAVAHGKPAIGEPYPHFDRVRSRFAETVPRVGSSGLWLTGLALRRVGISLPGLPANYSYYASQRVKSWDVAAPGFLLLNAGGVLEKHDLGESFFPLRQTYEGKETKFSVLASLTPDGAAAWRREILKTSSGGGDRAGPAAAPIALPRLERIHPERVAALQLQIAFFDLDGTLWRSTPYDVKALRWAQFFYGEGNVTPERFSALREFFVEHDRGDLKAQIAALDAWAAERNVGRHVGVVDGHEKAQNIEAETRRVRARPDLQTPGVRALLESLATSGIPLEVVTSGSEDTSQKTLGGLELASLFRRVHPGGDKENAVVERLKELGLTAVGAVLIGNDARDMKAARAAGALAVGIAVDEEHAAPLRAAGADAVVHGDFTDLASLRELLGLNRPPARSSGRAVSGISRVEIVRPDRVAAANLRLCFFDINGTLWRGYPFQIKAELWSRFLYNDAHPAPERVDEVRRFFIDTDWMSWGEQEKALAAWARERDLAPVHSPAGRERSEEIRKIVNKELVGLATPEQVLPGTRALLELLRESGVRLEVATSGSAETRNRVLRGLGLSGFFGTLHGGGKKGDVIGRRLAEEGMAGANAALIGDGRGDIAAARATGALAVGVASDEERAAVLRAAGADVLVHGDFADLPALLSALGFGGRREAPPWRVEPAEGDVRTLSPPADRGLAFPPTLRFENVLGNYKATVSETPADGPYLRSVALQKLPLISEQTGFEVFLSNQGLQRTGSFKPWILSGVLGRVAKDPEAFGRAHRFLTTPTTGNQGQSLAFFAEFLRRSYPRELGHLRAVVFVPRNAPPGKIDRMRAGGAEIRFTEDYAEAETRSREFAEREGAYFLAHGDERAVESYGALGLDLLTNIARREDPDVGLDQLVRWFDLKARSGSLNSSEAGELSALDTALSGIENTAFLIPVGAGGVVAGVDFALKSIDSRLTVIGVDSSRADPMAQSLARGEIVSQSPAPDILENGIAVNAPEPLAFQTAAGLLDAMVTVPFESVAGAVRAHWEEAGVVSEGAAALPYAALAQSKALVERLRRRGVRRVVLLGTGQNIPADAWTALTGASGFPEGPRGGGMHHAGEADLNSDQWKAVRARVRREATFEERRRWAADLRARVAHQRDWLDPLELTEPLLALADLLDQKKPTARGPLASLGVQPKASAARWYLLGPVAGEWSDRIEGAGERVPGRGRSPEEVRLYVTGLAAVIHEGLEHAVLPGTLGLNPKDRHTLAYLAEALANSWNDGPVPERTLEEMGHRRAVQLVGFVERSRAEIHQIRRRYSDRPALRERLESIVHRLRAHAELCLADLRAYPKPNAFFTAFRLADEAYWTGTVAEFGRSVRQLDRLTRQAAKEVQRPLPLWRTVAARFRARNAPWAAGPAARPPTDAVPNDFRAVRRSWDHFEFPEFSTALTRLAEHARQRPLEGGARDLFRLWAAVDQVIEPLRRRGDWRETETLMVEFADWVRAEAIVRGVGSPYWEKTALHLLRDLSLTVFEFHRLSAEEAREFGWAYELLDRVGREATPPALSLSDQRHLLAVLAGGATTPLERGVLYEKARAALPRFKGSFREKLEDVTLRAPRFNVPRGRPSPTEFLMGASWNSEFSDGDLTGLVRDYLSGEVSRPRLERLLAAGGDTPLSQIALALDQWDDALHPMPAGSGRLNARELSRWTARAAVGGAAAVFFVSTLGAVSGVPVDFRWIAPLLAPALLLGALAPLARPRFDPAQKPGRLSQFLSNARADPAAAFLEVVDGELRINPGALNRLSQWPVPVQNAILYGLGVVGHESLHRGGVGSEAAAYGVAQLLPALLGAGIVAALLGGASLAAAIASLGGAPLAAAATGMMLERWADGRLRDRRAESAAAALCAVRSGGLSPVDFKSLLSPRAMNLGVGGGPVTGHRLDGADDPVFAAGLKAALAKRGVAGPPEEIQSWLVRALRSSPDFAAADPVASALGDRPLTVVLVSRSVAARLEAVVRRAMADRAEGPATGLALIPLDAEGEAAVAQWNPLDRRVERWVQRPTRGSDRDPWDLSQVESLIRTRLNPASFTSCRVVAAADVPLRATGLATPLFREALVWLMEGLLPLSIETAELDRLTRLSRLVATSA